MEMVKGCEPPICGDAFHASRMAPSCRLQSAPVNASSASHVKRGGRMVGPVGLPWGMDVTCATRRSQCVLSREPHIHFRLKS